MKLCLTNAEDVLGKRILTSLENILTPDDTLMILSDIPQKIRFQNRTINAQILKANALTDLDVIINTNDEYIHKILECIDAKTFLIDATHTLKPRADAQLIDLSNLSNLSNLDISETDQANKQKKILILSHIVTLGICTVLKTILSACEFDFIAMNTCQAISDKGIKAMKALDRERKHEDMHLADTPQFFDNYIYSNVIPAIGEIDEHLHTSDEKQVVGEIKFLLDHEVNLSVTCVHMPIKIGHIISVQMHTRDDVDLNAIHQALRKNEDIIFIEKPVTITPRDSIGHEKIIVSRLRVTDTGVSFLATYDNLSLQAKTIEMILNALKV